MYADGVESQDELLIRLCEHHHSGNEPCSIPLRPIRDDALHHVGSKPRITSVTRCASRDAVKSRVVIVVFAAGGFQYVSLRYPDWLRPSGFGPELQCTERGASVGLDFCIKKQLLNPADQTLPR